jgi:hypothetical protein
MKGKKKRKGGGKNKIIGKKIEKRKKDKRRVSWTFHLIIHITRSEEVVLPNVFLKLFHI